MNFKHIKTFQLFEMNEISDIYDKWYGNTKWVDDNLKLNRYNENILVTYFKDDIIVDNINFTFDWEIEFRIWNPKILLIIDIKNNKKYNIENIYTAFIKAFNETSLNLYNIQKSYNLNFKDFSNEIGINFISIHRNTDDYDFIFDKLCLDDKTYKVCNKFRHNHIYVFFEENTPFKLDGVKFLKKKTIDNLDFEIFSDLKDYCLKEGCATFAYALNDYFEKSSIFLIGQYTGKKYPYSNQYSIIKSDYKNIKHIVIYSHISEDKYDVRGKVDLLDVTNEYDGNGYAVIRKEDFKKQLGFNKKKLLYFDNELYLEIIKRLDLYFS